MKKAYLLLVFITFIACTSQSEKQAKLYHFMVDRVWLDPTEYQYYFSSKDNSEYLWMAFEKRGTDTYIPKVPAKGTPFTNPLPAEESNYREGWYRVNYFRLEGEQLIRRDEDDLKEKMPSFFTLKIGENIKIGDVEYNTLEITNTYNNSTEIFISEKISRPMPE